METYIRREKMETYKRREKMETYKSKRKSVWPYALTLLIAGVLWMAAPAAVQAAHLGGSTGHPVPGTILTEDVRNTLHNLGDTISGFDNPNIVSTGREVCVFCHTPHGANTNAPGAAPLWNRVIPTSVFTTYSSPNFDPITAGQPQGVSLACLSCHDGVAGVDALVNTSGSGGFFGYTPISSNTVNPQGVSVLLDAGGTMTETLRTDTGPNYGVITGGAQPFPNLTINLSDDHPISFAMGTTDPQFDDVVTTDDGSITKISNGAGSGFPTDKRDSIRLYGANGANANVGTKADWVECASCHNPHAPRPLFLRLPSPAGVTGVTSATVIPATWGGDGTVKWAEDPNRGSAICLSCHTK